MTEAEIIRLAQSGDAAAFEHLYREHWQRVYATCLRMTGDVADADDLTQDAFLMVFRKIRSFRFQSAFSTWLHRLAVNVVLMNFRRRHVKETSLEETFEIESESSLVKQIGKMDQQVSTVAERVTLKRALNQLARGYKKVFLLHDLFGYEHHEIAKAMGRSIGTSKSQLHKARMRMRAILRNPLPISKSSLM